MSGLCFQNQFSVFQLFFFSPRVFAFTYLLGYCSRYLHCQQFIFSLILIFSLIRFSRVRFRVCPCVCLSVVRSPVCPFICLSIYPFVRLSICPFVHLSVCPFVCIVLSAFSIFTGPTHRALTKFLKHKKRKKWKKNKNENRTKKQISTPTTCNFPANLALSDFQTRNR